MERCSPTCEGMWCNECLGNMVIDASSLAKESEAKLFSQRLGIVEDVCRALVSSRIAETEELKRLLQLLQRPQSTTQSFAVPSEVSEVTLQPNVALTEPPKRLQLAIDQIVALKKSVAEGFPTDTLKDVFGCGRGTSSDAWCLARCVGEGATSGGVAFTVVSETGNGSKKLTQEVVMLDLEYRQARRNKISGETFFRLKRIGFGSPDPTSAVIKTSRKSSVGGECSKDTEWVVFRVQEDSSPQMGNTPQLKTQKLRKQSREEDSDKGVDDRTMLSSPSSSSKKQRTDDDVLLRTKEFKRLSESRVLEELEKDAQDNPQAERSLRSGRINNK